MTDTLACGLEGLVGEPAEDGQAGWLAADLAGFAGLAGGQARAGWGWLAG